MKAIWSKMGGQLGVGFILVGFLLVFLGWNGAASVDRVPAQFPYLISGGIAGLSFVVIGVGMIVVQNQRTDRAALQATLTELAEALERGGKAAGTSTAAAMSVPAGMVVAGGAAYHVADCALLAGRQHLEVLSPEAALERGLTSCRVCSPDLAEAATEPEVVEVEYAPPRKRPVKAKTRRSSA